MTTYYVDPDHPQASDDNPGTPTGPWRSWRPFQDARQPQDELCLAPGWYGFEKNDPPLYLNDNIVRSTVEGVHVIFHPIGDTPRRDTPLCRIDGASGLNDVIFEPRNPRGYTGQTLYCTKPLIVEEQAHAILKNVHIYPVTGLDNPLVYAEEGRGNCITLHQDAMLTMNQCSLSGIDPMQVTQHGVDFPRDTIRCDGIKTAPGVVLQLCDVSFGDFGHSAIQVGEASGVIERCSFYNRLHHSVDINQPCTVGSEILTLRDLLFAECATLQSENRTHGWAIKIAHGRSNVRIHRIVSVKTAPAICVSSRQGAHSRGIDISEARIDGYVEIGRIGTDEDRCDEKGYPEVVIADSSINRVVYTLATGNDTRTFLAADLPGFALTDTGVRRIHVETYNEGLGGEVPALTLNEATPWARGLLNLPR